MTPGLNPGPNPVVSASALGAVRLTLRPDRADFVATGTTGQLDNGSVPCQSAGTDTVPPTKPVLATPVASSTPTGASVALSWTASTDDRGVAGYRVRRDGIAVSGDLPAATLTYTDTPLQPSTQYTYTVEAFDSFGNTALSDPQTVTTPGTGQVVIQAPGSATQDTYAAANSPAAKGSATTVKVSSSASTSGQQITYLKFNVTGTSGVGKATLMLNATSTSSAATATVYGVADTTWSESTMTYPLRPAIGAAAAAPPIAGIAAGQWKSWDVTDLVAGNGTVSLALQQTGTNSTAMSFNSKENGTAALSPMLVIDPPTSTTPSTPTGLAGTATSPTTVALSWRASTSGAVHHYDVFRDGALIGTAAPVASPSYTDATAFAATTYSYSVAAVDAAGSTSAQSAAVPVTTPAGDTTGPTVVSTTPTDGATGVAVTTNATATFSEALAPATVTGQTVTLKDAAGSAVPASVSYDAASTTATLNPDADLAQGTTYTATVTGGAGGVTDTAGNPVGADTTWSFSTVAAPAPVASFTATPTSGQAPLAVQFTDTSTGNPTSWSWDFGDGTTATTQSPAHTYTAPGTYTVTLTAAIGTGPTTTANGTVTVAPPPPTASFTAAPTSGRAPLPVQFTDTSTGATAWSWDFGDGTTATTQSPAHTYTAPGTYTVTLTASNATGPSAPVTATVTATGVKFRASTATTGNSTGVAIPRPAGVANGDVLVMQLTADQNPTLSTLSGWTAIPSTPLSVGTGIREFAFYHVVTNAAAEPASYSWTLSAKLKWGAVMTAFSGVSTASPLETGVSTQVSTAAATSLTVPGVTATGTGTMLIGAIGLNNPGTAATPATGWTVGADSTGTQRAVLAYRYLATPAASGNLTWSLSKSAPSGGWLLALHAAG